MTVLKALFGKLSPVPSHRGWPRVIADSERWRGIGEALREGKLDLLGLWGDAATVHCAIYEPSTHQMLTASLAAHEGKFPSLAVFHAPATRPERTISELFGMECIGLPDGRPWLDHGRWPLSRPLTASQTAGFSTPES